MLQTKSYVTGSRFLSSRMFIPSDLPPRCRGGILARANLSIPFHGLRDRRLEIPTRRPSEHFACFRDVEIEKPCLMDGLRIAAVLPLPFAVPEDLSDKVLHRAVRGRIGSEVEAGRVIGEPRARRQRRAERKIAGERLEDVLPRTCRDLVPDRNRLASIQGAHAVGDDAVTFSHVSMSYASTSEEALTDIDFTAKRGETIGIIGGTGSGKSSVVNLIPRFYDVSKGSVSIDGKDVRDYDLTELRDKIGVVMQKAVLFQGTIAENLRWGKPDATDEELWKAIEVAQATDVVEGKEGKLDYMIEQGGRNLSGGQKQRLTIARAVVKNPDILILDDSASALDFATDARLRAALRNLKGNKTIFIVSQRTSSIQFADKIIVMDDGQVAGIGTHEQLLGNCEIYREIYESQFKKEDLLKINKGGAR